MKRLTLLVLLLFTIAVQAQEVSEKNRYEIVAVLTHQQKCWNNGDIDGYMDGYWKSDSLKFITKNGVTAGWEQTLSSYKQHYTSREMMGTLVFDEVSMLQMNTVTVFVMGRWTLQRTNETVGGRFTQLVKKIGGKWKIIIDHTS
ncbi:MAG TPA: nuclear transport factor 2 family protein [Bacteroidales bacterium]|jgi:ketosteroid isomerase-like protein|nr:nuclear transport factor 2 family protein [Bacteroidales bacterium]HNZ42060.1 nuclear transport factor 2 family protein [Bacteroidales bacterium]HOH83816.1 nuclear transport factor 2 family protein [Bacteroidales bacterium]HPB24533.1 nuclear transport factor 2 family protein [Bacteroidales bacterium]HPI29176.1 nuclear transport factor 2 family protein [Bacteroidales bacterium]